MPNTIHVTHPAEPSSAVFAYRRAIFLTLVAAVVLTDARWSAAQPFP